MNSYEAKQQARKARYEELSDKHRDKSTERYEQARDIGKHIPFGQPILVGHHSEGRHRSDLKKIDNNMRKSIEHDKTAKYYDDKAKGVGKAGISSDDPEAIAKLKAKIKSAEDNQVYMKKANRFLRLKDVEKGDQGLTEMGMKPETIHALRNPQFAYYGQGFAGFELKNNNANIRRMKKRLAALEHAATLTTKKVTYGPVEYVENAEDNRVQLFFPGKPDDATRKLLKSNGFRWSRYNGCWQHHLNNAGRYKAQYVLVKLGHKTDEISY